MQVQSINNQNNISVNFGIRPIVGAPKKYSKLLNEVADRFDVLNQKLDNCVSKRIRKDTKYYLEVYYNKLSLFQGGYGEHSITFAKAFLKQPVETIAQTLAKAAKIFSYDDKMFEKTCKYVNTINAKKHPQILKSDKFEEDIWAVYKKHIESAIYEEFNKDKQFELVKGINI